jgi:hypothetical protein
MAAGTDATSGGRSPGAGGSGVGHAGPTGSSPSGMGGRPEGGTPTGASRTMGACCPGLACGGDVGPRFSSAGGAFLAVTVAGFGGLATGAGRGVAWPRGAVTASPRLASTRDAGASRAAAPVRSALGAATGWAPGRRCPGARRASEAAGGVTAAASAGGPAAPASGTAATGPPEPDPEIVRSAQATWGSGPGTPDKEAATQRRSIATAICRSSEHRYARMSRQTGARRLRRLCANAEKRPCADPSD